MWKKDNHNIFGNPESGKGSGIKAGTKGSRPATHWDVTGANACKNCGSQLTGIYCSECGQKAGTRRLRFGSSIRSFFTNFFNVERGFLSTVRMLFTRPGYLSRDYIDGKRTARTNPFTLLFIFATVYGILNATISLYITGKPTATNLQADLIEEFGEGRLAVMLSLIIDKLTNTTVLLSLIMLPLYTLSIKVLFRRRNRGRYNYTELMYMGGYLASQRVLVDLAFLPYKWGHYGDDSYLGWVFLIYVLFTAYTLRQFFGIRWLKSLWKTLMVFLMSFFLLTIFVVVLALALAGIYYAIGGEEARVKLFGPSGNEKKEVRADSLRIDAVRVDPDSLPVFPDSLETAIPASVVE